MFKITTNAKQFIKELKFAEAAFGTLEDSIGAQGFKDFSWPKIRKKLIEHLQRNMDFISHIPTSRRWRETKRTLMTHPVNMYPRILREAGYLQRGYTTQRRGDAWLPVMYDDNWIATGTMHDTIVGGLKGNQGRVEGDDQRVRAEVEVDISGLNELYPNLVDAALMERTNDRVGIFRLFVWQQNEIFEMLIRETGNLSEELFGKKG